MKHSMKHSKKHIMGKSHAKKVSRSRRTNKRRSRRGGAQHNGNPNTTIDKVLPKDIVLSEDNVTNFIENITKEYKTQEEYDAMINMCENVTVRFFMFLITQDIDIKMICNKILRPILVNVLNETEINFPIKSNASNPQQIVNVTQPGGAMAVAPYNNNYGMTRSPFPSRFQTFLDAIGSVLPTTNLLDINNVITIFFLFITQQISVVTTGKQLNLTGGLVPFTEDQEGPIKIALVTCVNFMTIFAGMYVLQMMKQRQLQAADQRRYADENHSMEIQSKQLELRAKHTPIFTHDQVITIIHAVNDARSQGAANAREDIQMMLRNAHRLAPTNNTRIQQFVGRGYAGYLWH